MDDNKRERVMKTPEKIILKSGSQGKEWEYFLLVRVMIHARTMMNIAGMLL
jgi:hypothetical protein